MSIFAVEISELKPLQASGEMFVKDSLDRTISIAHSGTHVAKMVAYGIYYDGEEAKWKPRYHSGVFCSKNEFSIGGTTYKFCLIHAVPGDHPRYETTIVICFANVKSELESALGLYVGVEPGSCMGYQIEETAMGETDVPLCDLALLSVSLRDKIFSFSGFRESIKAQSLSLVPDGTTNCLHVASQILDVMGFETHFNDELMDVLFLCYRRVVDMCCKYGAGNFKLLALDMIACSRYQHYSTVLRRCMFRLRFKNTIENLFREKPHLGRDPDVQRV